MSASLSYPVSALKGSKGRPQVLILEPDLAVLDYLRLTLGDRYGLSLFSEEQSLLDRLEQNDAPDLLLLALHSGRDPMPLMRECLARLADRPKAELLWASPRELLNIFQADEVGCHIITATSDVLAKLSLVGKDLDGYSLETVKMFFNDAAAAGYSIG